MFGSVLRRVAPVTVESGFSEPDRRILPLLLPRHHVLEKHPALVLPSLPPAWERIVLVDAAPPTEGFLAAMQP